MKIGFDLDGVIVDHTLAKIKLAADSGWKITEKDTPSEILKNVLTTDILEKLQKRMYDEIHPSSFLMPGACEVVSKIKESGIEYFLISRRKLPAAAVGFLEKNKLWPEYFNKKNSFFVIEKEDKDTKAKELGITHYFDDEMSVLEKLKTVNNRFLFDSYNIFPTSDFYTKVSSWDDIKKQLQL